MNKRAKQLEKGITLIALVITIIVLLILAGVGIAMLMGENGILSKATEAKEKTKIAEEDEKVRLAIASAIDDNGNFNEDLFIEELEKQGLIYEKDINGNIVVETDNKKYTINNEGTLIEESKTEKEEKPTPEEPKEPVLDDKSGANTPTGTITGKQYITWEWNNTTNEYEEKPSIIQPDNWYDYENGKWANIKTTNNGLEAYWVWIPRYEYKVPESSQTTATKIDVRFIGTDKKEDATGYTTQSDGTVKSSDGYIIHPAFTNKGNGGFGELDGIWVGKFEASSNTVTPDSNYGGGEPSATNPLKVQVKPGIQSWRHIEVSKIFTVCRKMTNTGEVLAGSTVDSHMMKNTEWGAVSILSQSKYGVYNPQSSTGETQGVGDGTKKVWNNPYGYGSGATIKTGYVGNSADAKTDYSSSTEPSNVIEYNKIDTTKSLNGTKGSTTGTVYGVYDMAGGSWEYVAGVLKGNSNELEYAKSKFDITNQIRPNEVTEENFAKKYLDLYNYRTSSSDYSQYIIGDATVETKRWNGDYSNFVYSSYPVVRRGRFLLQWHAYW